MDMFLRSSDANILNEELDDKVSILESKNTLEYSDEKRFQDIMRVIKTQKQEFKTILHHNKTYDLGVILNEEYHVNQFMMVHFSELIFLKKNGNSEEYNEALTTKAKYLKKIYDSLNNQTVFVMLSDSCKLAFNS
jgi:hypothetical protein